MGGAHGKNVKGAADPGLCDCAESDQHFYVLFTLTYVRRVFAFGIWRFHGVLGLRSGDLGLLLELGDSTESS